MMWLTWRRHRASGLALLGATVALSLVMIWVAHRFLVLLQEEYARPPVGYPPNPKAIHANALLLSGPFSLVNQATALNALMLLLPCIAGLLLGVALVSGELRLLTNRMIWTQGVTRSRWFVTSWLMLAAAVGIAAGAFIPVSQWFFARTYARSASLTLPGETGRIQPLDFSITGLQPIAHAVFAFALAAALSALLRRTSIALVATVVVYVAVLVSMATVVRPILAPQLFVPVKSNAIPYPFTGAKALTRDEWPWNLGPATRFAPGFVPPGDSSNASAIAQRCDQSEDAGQCLGEHHVQLGTLYQPADHYWTLQWREALIFLGLTLGLFLTGLGAVRRWRS
jgi:hypothetical protein